MASSPRSDEELMLAYQQGDETAFDTLYARYAGRVLGFLRAKLKDPTVAEEVFQATFLKLHQSRARYDRSFGFAPWLFTICRNSLVDRLRSSQRLGELEQPDTDAVERAPAPPPEPEPSRAPDLSSLPAQQREAVELRYARDLSFDEIARRLGTTPVNARQLISRAIRKLRLSS